MCVGVVVRVGRGGAGGDNTKHNGVLRECVVYGLTSECACPIDSHKRTYI